MFSIYIQFCKFIFLQNATKSRFCFRCCESFFFFFYSLVSHFSILICLYKLPGRHSNLSSLIRSRCPASKNHFWWVLDLFAESYQQMWIKMQRKNSLPRISVDEGTALEANNRVLGYHENEPNFSHVFEYSKIISTHIPRLRDNFSSSFFHCLLSLCFCPFFFPFFLFLSLSLSLSFVWTETMV